jgi:DNA mismatch repair protein MutL
MGRIEILAPDVRGKIAAGEVITRPVSVIKELIENALDAGATRIDISVKEGGKRRCSVNDNGSGIASDDLTRAVERYGTSKIHAVDDIERIATYGFRGEALASIAQVSQLEIETSDGTSGSHITVHGGVINGTVASCRSQGTRVTVTDLFYNLPVRAKFLKSGQREKQLIIDLVREYAAICTEIHFTVTADDRETLNIPASRDLAERMRLLVPGPLYGLFVPLTVHIGGVQIVGLFTRPDFQERHRITFLSVNDRPVKYPRFYRTIMHAYQNPKNPPAFVLHIHVPPEQVDVNIHPTKHEVKLRDEQYVVDLLSQSLKKYVLAGSFAPEERMNDRSYGTREQRPGSQSPQFVQDTIMEAPRPYPAQRAEHDVREFWQVHDMFVFAQTRSGLIILDQHAAHERIIYESIMQGRCGSQRLLFPITLDLTPEEYHTYRKTKAILHGLGIDFKEFSSRTVVIDSVPIDTQVNRDDLLRLFRDIDGLGNLVKEKGEIAKVVACHTAIKAGQRLSEIEMQNLIDRLFACEHPYTCPHGRPAVIRMSMDELAAKFGRT